MTPEQAALVALGRALRDARYTFVTVTPETHRRVLERAARSGRGEAQDLRDVFGWNLPFRADVLPARVLSCLEASGALEQRAGLLRSRVRFATLGEGLFAHSSYPTHDLDAVFFGPDTYRFCTLLGRWAPAVVGRAIDIGCGSGAGGLSLRAPRELILADLSPPALRFASVNAALAERDVTCAHSDVLAAIDGSLDLIIANPPYMRDDAARLYRDGGGQHGEALSVRIVREGLARLQPGGTLILYTGSAIVAGVDQVWHALRPILPSHGVQVTYEELDPDVFGEELERPGYAEVERIAAVGLKVCVS